MREEGWGYATIASSHEHYFVNGKSLCGKFLLLGHKVFESTHNPCSDCVRLLTQNNTKKETDK
mgnify:CR=1 FL=1